MQVLLQCHVHTELKYNNLYYNTQQNKCTIIQRAEQASLFYKPISLAQGSLLILVLEGVEHEVLATRISTELIYLYMDRVVAYCPHSPEVLLESKLSSKSYCLALSG